MQVYELRSLEEGAGKNLCVKLDSILGYTTSIAFITASRSITILAIIIRVRIVRIHVFIYLSLLWLLLSVLLILLRILYVNYTYVRTEGLLSYPADSPVGFSGFRARAVRPRPVLESHDLA